jgi:hypothetical protein
VCPVYANAATAELNWSAEMSTKTVRVPQAQSQADANSTEKEVKQLERLYDYTKFHIGIYLSAAGGLAGLISAAANSETGAPFRAALSGAPKAIVLGFVFMVLAGMCGACVATSAIECATYQDFVSNRQGAFGITLFRGKTWVRLEHGFFWMSLVFIGVAVFSAPTIHVWLWSHSIE